MGLHSAAILTLALAAPTVPLGPAPVPAAQEGRRSLEELLEEARRAKARRQAELQPVVAEVMATLDETLARRPTATTDAAKRELLGLGEDVLPLLIPFLDPGDEPTAGSNLRARIVSEVLHEQPSLGVTDALLEGALTGSTRTRRNALYALRTTPEPDRVFGPLAEAARSFPGGGGEEGAAAPTVLAALYRTIAALGTEASQAFVAEELASGNRDRQRLALDALGSGPADAVRIQVITLLASPSAVDLAAQVASFLDSRDALLADDDLAEATMGLALADGIDVDSRVALFDVMRLTDADLSSTDRRRVEREFAEASHPEVRKAALLLLARNGLRSAKRELLGEFDERLDRARNLDWAYRDRALVHHAIGDWSAAVKDWRTAMKFQKENRFRQPDGTEHVGIARSLARLGKFREAAEYLRNSPLSLAERRGLAGDRDFREMLDSKYADAFRLDD